MNRSSGFGDSTKGLNNSTLQFCKLRPSTGSESLVSVSPFRVS